MPNCATERVAWFTEFIRRVQEVSPKLSPHSSPDAALDSAPPMYGPLQRGDAMLVSHDPFPMNPSHGPAEQGEKWDREEAR